MALFHEGALDEVLYPLDAADAGAAHGRLDGAEQVVELVGAGFQLDVGEGPRHGGADLRGVVGLHAAVALGDVVGGRAARGGFGVLHGAWFLSGAAVMFVSYG